jgi:hypothetical protein
MVQQIFCREEQWSGFASYVPVAMSWREERPTVQLGGRNSRQRWAAGWRNDMWRYGNYLRNCGKKIRKHIKQREIINNFCWKYKKIGNTERGKRRKVILKRLKSYTQRMLKEIKYISWGNKESLARKVVEGDWKCGEKCCALSRMGRDIEGTRWEVWRGRLETYIVNIVRYLGRN